MSPLAEDLRADVEAALAVEPDALLYLGLGVAARAVALAVEAVGWTGPVVTNSALMFGYARPDWRSGFEDWVYVDTISDGNPVRAALRERPGCTRRARSAWPRSTSVVSSARGSCWPTTAPRPRCATASSG